MGNLTTVEITIVLSILFLPIFLWVFAIIDLFRREFKDQSNKIIWALIILLIPFFGPVSYFLFGRKGGVK